MTKLTKEKKIIIQEIKKASVVNQSIKPFINNLKNKNMATEKINEILLYLDEIKAPLKRNKKVRTLLRDAFERGESPINSFRVDEHSSYILDKKHCDKIMDILLPTDLYQKLDKESDKDLHRISNLRDRLRKKFTSSLIRNLNEKISNKQLAGLVKTGKQYCNTKSALYNKDNVKRGLILKSSAYKYVGECIYSVIIEQYFKRYIQPNKQIKTFNKLYDIYNKDQKDLTTLDYKLIEHLIKKLKNDYILKLITYDPKMKNQIKKNDYIIILQKKIRVLNEACKIPSLNGTVSLGMQLLEDDKEFVQSSLFSNYFDLMRLSRPVPLLSTEQSYPHVILANNTETLDCTYDGSYIGDDVTAEDFYHKYQLDPKESQVCLDLFKNRFENEINTSLFIDFFFAFKFDIKYAIAEIRKNYVTLANDLYNFILDFDNENLESAEKFIREYADILRARKRAEDNEKDKFKEEIVKRNVVIKLYQQIKSKKYVVAEALYLLPIYSRFAYYVSQSVTTYTGRRFPISTGLDILYKPIRSIARVYDIYTTPEAVMKGHSRKLKMGNEKHPGISDIKISYEELYMKKNDPNVGLNIHIEHYLNSLIKNNEEIIKLNLTKFNVANLKILCYDYGIDIYKAVRYLIARESLKNGRAITIEKDSLTSGTQLTSVLRRDKRFAYMCGLVEPIDEQCDDIYMHVMHRLNACITECVSLYGTIIEEKHVDKFKWLFKFNHMLGSSKEDFLEEFLRFTGTFMHVLMQRKLWKAIVMPQQYGMTNYSMRKVLREALIEKLGDYPKNKALIWIGVYIEWFNIVIKQELFQTEKYLSTFKRIKEDIKQKYKRQLQEYKANPKKVEKPFIPPINFQTNVFKWQFKSYKLKDHKVKVRGQQMKLYIKSEDLHLDNMFRSLPPILIHALDANIVHNLTVHARKNEYPISTIHDCFLVSSNHLVVLLLEARAAYIAVYKANLFKEFIVQNNFDAKYLDFVLDESDPFYLKEEDLIVIEKGGLFKFLT